MSVIEIKRDTSREVQFEFRNADGTAMDLTGYSFEFSVSGLPGWVYTIGAGLRFEAPNLLFWRYPVEHTNAYPAGQVAGWRLVYDAPGADREVASGMISVV